MAVPGLTAAVKCILLLRRQHVMCTFNTAAPAPATGPGLPLQLRHPAYLCGNAQPFKQVTAQAVGFLPPTQEEQLGLQAPALSLLQCWLLRILGSELVSEGSLWAFLSLCFSDNYIFFSMPLKNNGIW